jgi:hypothetical protein
VLPRKVLAGLSGKAGAAAGFNAHTSRLVASKSTANSDLYQNADGSFTRRLAAAPINFRNPAGAWQPIVTTLAQQGPGRWAQQANSDGVSFAPTGASRLLTTVAPAPGQSVSTALAGGAAVAPVVSASTITYPGVRPGTDLVAYSTAAGARESLVLHSASAASSWVFPLSLQGLQPVPAAGGAVDLVTPGGKVAAFIPAGYADDSAKVDLRSGKSTATGAVSYQLTTYQGAPALQVTLDPAWLNDPARVFPVTVNAATLKVPTTGSAAPRVLPASAAPAAMAPASFNGVSQGTTTYAESQLPGDHSLEETMSAGSPDSGTHKAVSYVQFPGLGLDGSKITVSSASLNLAVVYASTCTAERFDVAQGDPAVDRFRDHRLPRADIRVIDRERHPGSAERVRELEPEHDDAAGHGVSGAIADGDPGPGERHRQRLRPGDLLRVHRQPALEAVRVGLLPVGAAGAVGHLHGREPAPGDHRAVPRGPDGAEHADAYPAGQRRHRLHPVGHG